MHQLSAHTLGARQSVARTHIYRALRYGAWMFCLHTQAKTLTCSALDFAHTLAAQGCNWFFVPKGKVLCIQNPEGGAFFYAILHPLFLDAQLRALDKQKKNRIEQQHLIAAISPDDAPVKPSLRHAVRQYLRMRQHTPGYESLLLQSYATQFLLHSIGLFQEDGCGIDCRLKSYQYQRIIEAERILRSNVAEPCKILSLANRVGINDCTLKCGFKHVYGTTIYNYFIRLRMQSALNLLQQTEKTVQEVADAVGYKSCSNFSAAFKRVHGCTPLEIRSRAHAKE